MELIQIRYFIAAAQFQNLSKAAHVLNVTQPALSKSISKLEAELGVQLFDRSGKKIALNERGERFLEHAISSIHELDTATAAAKNLLFSRPSLYIGLFLYSESFMQCLGEFSKVNPDVSFQIEHLEISSHDIDTNNFDMLLYPKISLFRKYKGFMAYLDSYFLAVNKSDPFARTGVARLRHLSGRKVVFIKHSNTLFDLPYHRCFSLDIQISDAMFTNNYDIQKWLVSNNYCVGFVPQSCAAAYTADPNITLIPLDDEGLNQEIMVGFKREKHLCAIGRQFAAFVRDHFEAYDAKLRV